MAGKNDFVEITYEKSKYHSWMVSTTKFDHPTGNFELSIVDSEFTRGAKRWENQVRWVKGSDGTVRSVIDSSQIEFLIFDLRLPIKANQPPESLGDMRGVVVGVEDYRTIEALFLAGKLTSRLELEEVLEEMDVILRY
jgi:hypothetical protein